MLEVLDWGAVPYRTAWARQKERLTERVEDRVEDALVFCEHRPAVITLGRGAQRGELPWLQPAPGTEVVEIERGGLATWHGPGQVVVYPVIKLNKKRGLGVVTFIRRLEEAVIEALGSVGVQAQAVEGKTGVWIEGERKVASIGIAVSHWVTYHGLAFNFSTGKDPWRTLSPCGFSPDVMTDLATETGRPWTYEETRDLLTPFLRSRLLNAHEAVQR